jgi:hypothetical protein
MAITLPFTRRNSAPVGSDAPLHNVDAATATSEGGADDTPHRLENLFVDAERLEVELETLVARGVLHLTAGQVGRFNAVLRAAQDLLPDSKALREDAGPIDEDTHPSAAHHGLHLTIVPTLHNALPDDLYRRHA